MYAFEMSEINKNEHMDMEVIWPTSFASRNVREIAVWRGRKFIVCKKRGSV